MGVGGQPHTPAASTPGKDPISIVQEAGWAPGPEISSPTEFDPGPSSPLSVAIPIELPGPPNLQRTLDKRNVSSTDLLYNILHRLVFKT